MAGSFLPGAKRRCRVKDIDTAIAYGPGLRWALLGPFLNLALSGGPGGIAHVLEHLGPPMDEWAKDLGEASFLNNIPAIAEGVSNELEERHLKDIGEERERVLLELLALKQSSHLP
jgi:carnitine 3-dehydrogenase